MTLSAVLTINAKTPALPEHSLAPWPDLLAHRPLSLPATKEKYSQELGPTLGLCLSGYRRSPALLLSSALLGRGDQMSLAQGWDKWGSDLQMEILQQTFRMFTRTHPVRAPTTCLLRDILVRETCRGCGALYCRAHSLACSGSNSDGSSLARAEVS